MKTASGMIAREIESQREQFGLEHDIQHHGSQGLVDAAFIIASIHEPSTAGYDGEEWFFNLRIMHINDPAKRFAIAAAMLHSAIECSIYEKGLKV